MSASEKHLRKQVAQILKEAGRNPMPVENVCAVGCPDLYYIEGWIELKSTPHWTQGDGPFLPRHGLSPEQRIWLRRHCRAGGKAFVLMQVDREYLLFDGAFAADRLGYASKLELMAGALLHCPSLDELRSRLPQIV